MWSGLNGYGPKIFWAFVRSKIVAQKTCWTLRESVGLLSVMVGFQRSVYATQIMRHFDFIEKQSVTRKLVALPSLKHFAIFFNVCVEKMGYGMTLPSAHSSVLEFVIFPRRNLTVDFTISFIMGLYHYIIWLIYSSGRKLVKFSHSLISSLFFQYFLLVSFFFSKSIIPGAIVSAPPHTHTP